MRLLLITGMLLAFLSCKKDHTPENGLPLDQIHGKILYTEGTNLVELDIQSGISKVIPDGLGTQDASWSPDGQLLMRGTRINSNNAIVFKITDPQGNLVYEFDNPDVHEPCWSPDGKKVAFFNYEKKIVTKIELSTFARDTFKFHVGNMFWQQGSPDWSPDGKTFVFSALDENLSKFNLWRINIDGTNLLKLTDDGAWYPQWSPDDQEIACATFSGLEAIGSDGNHYRPLVTEGTTPHWSADGKLLMYSLKKDPSLGTGGQEIRVRNLETGEERLLVAHATLLSWYPVE